jgi:hypothetical protein
MFEDKVCATQGVK